MRLKLRTRKLLTRAQEETKDLRGMGTTMEMVATIVGQLHAYVANVGDSRLYV